VQAGTVVATLQNLDKMKVDFTIPEQSLASVKIGQPAKFGQSADNMTLTGTITGIDPKIDPQTRLVSLQAVIDNPQHSLRPGQFIRILVELPPEDGVIALPQTAVVASLYGDYVFTVEPAPAKPDAKPAAEGAAPQPPALVAKQVFVKTGRRSFRDIEILSGVKAGDQVVSAGQNRLSANAPVKIDNTIDPSTAAIEGGK
jgi:membrane fusion protein (multidrug efflux system)